MSDIPEGVELNVANIALAWEIVKQTFMKHSHPTQQPEEYMREVTNAYLTVHRAIIKNQGIEEKK